MKLDLEQSRMRLSGKICKGHRVEGADLRGALAQQSGWQQMEFINCRFDGANMAGSAFSNCTFTGCNLSHGIWSVRFHECLFENCNLDQSTFEAALLTDTTFKRSRAQLSHWHRATLRNCKMDVDFRGANLNLAATNEVDWSGANFWSALIPINCAFIEGNTLDDRQVKLFASLLLHGKLPENTVFKLSGLTDERSRKIVEKLVAPRNEVEFEEIA